MNAPGERLRIVPMAPSHEDDETVIIQRAGVELLRDGTTHRADASREEGRGRERGRMAAVVQVRKARRVVSDGPRRTVVLVTVRVP